MEWQLIHRAVVHWHARQFHVHNRMWFDQAYHRCVVSKFADDVGAMCGCTVMCVQGVQEWVEDAAYNRTGHRQQKNDIQIGNVQNGKNTIYNTDNYVKVWYVQIWNGKKSVWWINNCIIVLCVPCLMSSVHEMDCLGEETVSVSGRSGAQSSVALTRR